MTYLPDDPAAGEAEARATAPTTPVAGLSSMGPLVGGPAAPPVSAAPASASTASGGADDVHERLLGMSPREFTNTMLPAFRDPDLMMRLGEIAVKYQQPQFLDYLKRGYEAQKENAGDAMLALARGDTAQALTLFNASGQHKADSISDNGDGTFNINAAGPDGTPYVRKVNPTKDIPTFLTLPEFIKHGDREKALDTKAAALDAQGKALDAKLAAGEKIATMRDNTKQAELATRENYLSDRIANAKTALEMQGALNEAKGKLTQAQIELAQSRAGLADAQAGRADAQAANAATPQADQKTLQQVKEAAGKSEYANPADKLGEKKLDGSRYNMVASMAQNLVKSDPQKYRGNGAQAVLDAQVKLQEIDGLTKRHVDAAVAPVIDDAPGTLSLPSTKKDYWKNAAISGLDGAPIKVPSTGPVDFKRKAAEVVTKQAQQMAGVRGNDPDGGSVAVTVPTNAASGAIRTPATAAPAQPKSKAEFDVLPSGAIYINPADGKPYRKK